jgi:hypothetical protein
LNTDAGAHFEEYAMKRAITTTAVLLAAFGLASEVQARDHGYDPRGGQQHGGQSHGWQDRGRRDHDGHRWGAPYYRDYGYRHPRHYYSRPYYGDSWRYYRPPVYRGGYYYDCDDYYYDCYDDGFSLLFSLPLH